MRATTKISEKSYELLKKILHAVVERSRDELVEIEGEKFVRLGEGSFSDFQKKKASRVMANDFHSTHKKDKTHSVDLETFSVDSWGVLLSLPGADREQI